MQRGKIVTLKECHWKWKSVKEIQAIIYYNLERTDMTLDQLSERMGAHRSCILDLMGGRIPMDEKKAEAFAKAFDIHVNSFKEFQRVKNKPEKGVKPFTLFFIIVSCVLTEPFFWIAVIYVYLIGRFT